MFAFLGGGISDGAQGVDLASIPGLALKQVEVLRDGASSQYGSDAIAGVLNFILRDTIANNVTLKLQALIGADQKTPHGQVVRLIDKVRQGGISDFAINVESASGN